LLRRAFDTTITEDADNAGLGACVAGLSGDVGGLCGDDGADEESDAAALSTLCGGAFCDLRSQLSTGEKGVKKEPTVKERLKLSTQKRCLIDWADCCLG
jgi:hypothetical protein